VIWSDPQISDQFHDKLFHCSISEPWDGHDLIEIYISGAQICEDRLQLGNFADGFSEIISQMTDHPLLGIHFPTGGHISGFPTRGVAGRHETF
jgi:hypothetical protein